MTATPQTDRREWVALSARVQITCDADTRVFDVANASTGGLVLIGDLADFPDLKPGADVELTLLAMGGDADDVTARGRIVKIAGRVSGARPGGLGIEFTAMDEQSRARLQRLLDQAARAAQAAPAAHDDDVG